MRENTDNPCMKNSKPFERVVLFLLLKIVFERFFFNSWVILFFNKISSENFFDGVLDKK